mmetsp:Transcript_122458/g.391830  ORF Transcript_122458/g.391830 Transcript_122458/m.391830 type:complete len:224 (+) Transcript_122458:98-769(+)
MQRAVLALVAVPMAIWRPLAASLSCGRSARSATSSATSPRLAPNSGVRKRWMRSGSIGWSAKLVSQRRTISVAWRRRSLVWLGRPPAVAGSAAKPGTSLGLADSFFASPRQSRRQAARTTRLAANRRLRSSLPVGLGRPDAGASNRKQRSSKNPPRAASAATSFISRGTALSVRRLRQLACTWVAPQLKVRSAIMARAPPVGILGHGEHDCTGLSWLLEVRTF